MRLRIRGPSGQSTTMLDDSATIETLRKTIETQTALTSFEIKFGYPPKPLPLEQYPPTRLLTELEVKLNGEQLIVSETKSASQTRDSQLPAPETDKAAGSSNQPANVPQSFTASSKSASKSSAPLALSRKKKDEMNDPPEIWCPDLGGNMVLRIMPDDNSCLFRAVASAVLSEMDAVHELRSIIAQSIQANSEKYSKAILDNKDPDTYCRWIQTQDAWGGQIELDILSQHFDIEICSIDVQSLRVDHYNEEALNRCFIVYSGIHYDTIALSTPGAPPEADVKQFMPPLGEEALPKAVELCKKLQEKHYFTDTAGFSLLCNDCGTALTGEAGAMKHAQETGHSNFGEAS
jgi:ubiquitin thioesterase OTU1